MINKLKIGFLSYKVIEWDRDEASSQGFWGIHNSRDQTLKIDNSLSKERKKEVLLHEIFHAIWDQWMGREKEIKEEEVVEALSKWLTTVFMDNPELKKELF